MHKQFPENGPLIQVAGALDLEDALTIAEAGATHIGFPLHLDVHAQDVTEEQAAQIIAQLPPSVTPVLITYLERAEDILRCMDAIGVHAVQAHGPLTPEQAEQLKLLRPDCFLIKSLVVGRGDPSELCSVVEQLSPFVGAFISDTFDPDTGASGATGKEHDRETGRELVRLAAKFGLPLIMAGGLNADNVAAAIKEVRPAGVDAHTGLESPDGRKDADKVRRFVQEARKVWPEAGLGNRPPETELEKSE